MTSSRKLAVSSPGAVPAPPAPTQPGAHSPRSPTHRALSWDMQGQWLLRAGFILSRAPTATAAPSSTPRHHLLSQPVFISTKWAVPSCYSLHHPPGRDKVQQPVGPDLLNATMRNSTHVGQVKLLVPAEVVLLSLAVWQRGTGDRTRGVGALVLVGGAGIHPAPTSPGWGCLGYQAPVNQTWECLPGNVQSRM